MKLFTELSRCSSVQFKNIDIHYSVVTTTERSSPLSWLATTEPTLPSRCFTVFSAVFLGAVSLKLPLCSIIWSLRERTARHCPPSPARPLTHSQTTGMLIQQGQSRHCTKWDGQSKSDCHQTSSVIPLATGDEVIKFWKVIGQCRWGVCAVLNALLVFFRSLQ